MHLSSIHQSIGPIIESSLNAMGYRLVRIIWQGSEKRRILQIMAEHVDGSDMMVEDCEDISHMVSALLDVKDPIEGAYELEVSSPGVDRPLMNAQDFANYIGHEVKAELAIPQDGRKRFRSFISEVDEENLTLRNGGECFVLPIEDLAAVKLIMSDALMQETAERLENNLKT